MVVGGSVTKLSVASRVTEGREGRRGEAAHDNSSDRNKEVTSQSRGRWLCWRAAAAGAAAAGIAVEAVMQN